VTCTATNNCGGNATCYFAITVKPKHPFWLCAFNAVGLEATPLGQAHFGFRPNLGSSGQDGVSIDNLGSSGQDGVRLAFGPAQKITFDTKLDFNQPEGAQFDIALPPDAANQDGLPLLSFRSKGAKGYCVKTNKKFTDDPSATYRHTCIETNGDLHSSITWDAENMETNVLLNINHLPEVTSVLMTVTLDCVTREVTLAFPDCIWTTDARRKGWDGCIYGNSPPGRPMKKTAALVLSPQTAVVSPPITALDLRASRLNEVTIEEPAITAAGRKWGDGHVTLMKAYDDGSEEGLIFTSFGPGGGVHVDLGHSESFNMKLKGFFEHGGVPTEDQLLTRTFGPIRLINRPPPPFLDALLLHGTTEGVECSADFSNIDSPTAHVIILHQGVVVAERTGVPAQLGQPLLVLPDWPVTLGKVGGRVSCRSGTIKPPGPIRLPGGGGGLLAAASGGEQVVVGDEFRVLAEMPEDALRPDFYSAFEFVASDGPTWQVSGLQRTLACAPGPVAIRRTAEGILITWSDDRFHLQGAEDVAGPWFDLGADSPVSLSTGHPARFFRLACD
jgi:hypothetical protein